MIGRAHRVVIENIITNYAYIGLMGMVTILFVPAYVKALGGTQWGLVALCMTVQGGLLLLDAGLGQIMPREFARAGDPERARQLFVASLKLYLMLALVAFVVGQMLAGTLASMLAKSNDKSIRSSLEIALRLVFLQFLFQFPNNAALAYWNGTEQQRTSNSRLALFAATKHCSALALVVFWQPTVISYLIPFAAVSGIEFLINSNNIISAAGNLSKRKELLASSVSIYSSLKGVCGFSAGVLLGMLTSQVDRIYLARIASMELYGVYVVVANFALTLMHLQAPIQKAFLPRVVASPEFPWREFRRMVGLLLFVSLLPCILSAVFAENILSIWLSNPNIARLGAPVFALIAISVGMNGIYSAFYTIFIRENMYRSVIATNALILGVQGIVLVGLAGPLSIQAGGWAWLASGLIQVCVGGYLVAHRWMISSRLLGASANA